MSSVQHAIATKVVPWLRRNPATDDLPALRDALTARNREADEGRPAPVRHGQGEQISNGPGFPVLTLWRPGGRSGIDDAPRRSVVYLPGGAYVRGTSAWH